MKVVIMAGGKGVRLQKINSEIPKPMFPILDRPILEYQIESLKKSNITDITIVLGHLGSVIKDFFEDGKKFDVNIDYVQENEPLGSAGALYYLKCKLDDDFILLFGDIMLDIDFNRFFNFHKDKNAKISLFAHPNSHPYDSDLLELDSYAKVLNILPKNGERDFYYKNLVNAGIYCLKKSVVDDMTELKKLDLDKDIVNRYIDSGSVYAYSSSEYVKDMGTPDRLVQVTDDIKNNIVYKKSFKNKQKAVFIDRDGTINVLKGQLSNINDFELIDKVSDAIKNINNSEYLAIVITNQPVVARGECTVDELNMVHNKLETLLGKKGAYINKIYYCPHHPDSGFEGEVKELKVICDCRKPKTGLIDKAIKDFNIDIQSSWLIGDTTTDIMTGINAGLKTILVKTGECGKDGKYNVNADLEANDLYEAVNMILRG